MNVLVDSTVVARKLLGEPDALAVWEQIQSAYASRLMPVELSRLIDRLRLIGRIDDERVVALYDELRRLMRAIELINVTENILVTAGNPMPTVLGTLDAIHLATAIELQRSRKQRLDLATHDVQLGRAARALGFVVYGTP